MERGDLGVEEREYSGVDVVEGGDSCGVSRVVGVFQPGDLGVQGIQLRLHLGDVVVALLLALQGLCKALQLLVLGCLNRELVLGSCLLYGFQFRHLRWLISHCFDQQGFGGLQLLLQDGLDVGRCVGVRLGRR